MAVSIWSTRSRLNSSTHRTLFRVPLRARLLVAVLALCLAVLLSLATWATPRSAATMPGRSPTPGTISAQISEAWERLFTLTPASAFPPPAIRLPPWLPPPPHLEDCAARAAFRLASERAEGRAPAQGDGKQADGGQEGAEQGGVAQGGAPEWVRGSAACGNVPQPPWVRGGDASNLGGTRAAQRDLWLQQFPPGGCEGRRLLLVAWPHARTSSFWGWKRFGAAEVEVAQQLEAMGGAVSVAVSSGRVLVPMPGTFLPATHKNCQGLNASQSLDCYFFPMVSAQCEAAAMHLYQAAGSPPCQPLAHLGEALASNQTLVCAQAVVDPSKRPDSTAARMWGDAFKQRPYLVEENGIMVNASEEDMQANWWQAQALRFLLRWPSLHLCHALNRARHSAYGVRTAVQAAAVMAQQSSVVAGLKTPWSNARQGLGIDIRHEANLLASLSHSPHPNLQSHIWPALGFAGCDGQDAGLAGGSGLNKTGGEDWADAPSADDVGEKPTALVTYERVGREVFMPRPIVSMHVEELGGSGRALLLHMLLLGFRLRRREPGLKYVWLSREQQRTSQLWGSFSRTLPHFSWSFVQPTYAQHEDQAAAAFANLLVSSECDYVVGDLSYAWSRAIHALRATNGRIYSGFLSYSSMSVV